MVAQRTPALRTGILARSASKTANLDLSVVAGLFLCKESRANHVLDAPDARHAKLWSQFGRLRLGVSNVKIRFSFRKATVILQFCHVKKMDPDPFPPQPQIPRLILGKSSGLWPDFPFIKQGWQLFCFSREENEATYLRYFDAWHHEMSVVLPSRETKFFFYLKYFYPFISLSLAVHFG